MVKVTPPPAEAAAAVLADLLRACQLGLSGHRPVPTALSTGLAWLSDPGKARLVYEGSDFGGPAGEGQEPCLARLYPDFAALAAQPGFEAATQQLYQPFSDWLSAHVHIDMLEADAPSEEPADG